VNQLKKIVNNKRLVKYFIMAVVIVCIELGNFQIIYLLTRNYYLATILSFLIGVILNWFFGRLYVFGTSLHHPAKEFTMVLIASLVGVGIQLVVVGICVNVYSLYPILGKMVSIIFSFFWNYWYRSKYIFKNEDRPL
jgi:putative flippase GtrA